MTDRMTIDTGVMENITSLEASAQGVWINGSFEFLTLTQLKEILETIHQIRDDTTTN